MSYWDRILTEYHATDSKLPIADRWRAAYAAARLSDTTPEAPMIRNCTSSEMAPHGACIHGTPRCASHTERGDERAVIVIDRRELENLLAIARETAEHHEASKHARDPDTAGYVECRLLAQVERVEAALRGD